MHLELLSIRDLAQIVDELNVEGHGLARDRMPERVAAQHASGGFRLERHLWGGEGAVVSTCMLAERMCIGALSFRCEGAVK